MTDRALVTGAAGDLGRATCLGLAADGWSLWVADHPRAEQELEATREICAAAGADVAAVTFDVTDAARSRMRSATWRGDPARRRP